MNREVRLSDRAREMLDKQLELLVEQNWYSTKAETSMAILNLVEVLERDDQLRERDAKVEEWIEVERRCSEEQELEEQREMELEEEMRREQIKRIRFVLRVLGITLLCSLLASLCAWLVL